MNQLTSKAHLMSHASWTSVTAFAVLLSLTTSYAARPAIAQQDSASNAVLATVDGHPITASDVQRELQRVITDRPVESSERAVLKQAALEQLIKQRLVLAYLAAGKLAASDADVRFALDTIRRTAEQRGSSLDAYLVRQQLTERQLRDRLYWQISWQRYLDRFLTDENLERYFEKHRRHFDGSQVRAAHILIKPTGEEEAALAAAQDRAAALAAQIRAGEITFAEAARQHSQAPTAADAGDIGWIERHEPMPEAFSRAAFELQPGEVSAPVTTPFGVHLVTCLELKPGARTWRDARGELEKAVTAYLFAWCAEQRRDAVRVEYHEPSQ